jgi:predicted GNAT family acetyltransferase
MTVAATVRNNPARSRYELEVDGGVAVAAYVPAAGVVTFVHTQVPAALRGRGVGSRLVAGALADVRRQGMKVVARCSFVKAFMGQHPELSDLLA